MSLIASEHRADPIEFATKPIKCWQCLGDIVEIGHCPVCDRPTDKKPRFIANDDSADPLKFNEQYLRTPRFSNCGGLGLIFGAEALVFVAVFIALALRAGAIADFLFRLSGS